jgi:photosystem II stability/assembly factor-like uncharacterized protein
MSRSAHVAAVAALAALAGPIVSRRVAAQQPRDSLRPPAGAAAARTAPRDTARPDTLRAAPSDPLTRFLGGFTFRNLGPAAFSGRVTALAVPRPYRKTIYVGAAGGGVWKTTNAGVTWRPVGDSIGALTIGDLAIAPSDTNVIWVGTGEKNSLRSQSWGNGVHKSTNGGRTWQHVGLTGTRSIGRIVIHPSNPAVVYVAALGHLWGPNPERGIYKTTDGGRTWSRILFVNDTTGFVDLEMDPTNPDVLYAAAWHRLRHGGSRMQGAGAGSGIYRTDNGGRTWTRLTDPRLRNGLPTERMGRIGLAIAESNPRVVYAFIAVDRAIVNTAQGAFGGVFRSADGGATWTHVNDVSANPHYFYDDVWVDPSNADRVYLTTTFLLKSRDGGRTFEQDSTANVHVDYHALWIDPADPQHMIVGTDGGVYVTWDGGRAWDHQQIPIGQFYTVTVDSSQTPYQVCGGLQDNGVWCGPSITRDSVGVTDADWYALHGGDGMWVQIPWHDPHTVYSETQFGNMARTDLRTWKRDFIKPMSLDAGAESGYELVWGWTPPLVLSQHDSTVLYAGANRLIRMRNRGNDWEIVGPDMTRADRSRPEPEGPSTSYHALFSIAESPRRPEIIWTGSDDGLVWVTRDLGRTWANVTDRFPRGAPTRCFVGAIVASRFADGTAYLVYDCHHRDDYRPHAYRTADFGRTWTQISSGLPADGGSLTIFEHPSNPRVLWIGTARGLFVTVDAGRSWRPFGRGLPPVPVEKMSMSFAQRELVLGTHGRGLWVANVSALDDYTETLLGEPARLFPIPPALQYYYSSTYHPYGARPFVARNPARGASISYYLRDAQPGPVDVVITTTAGDTVRRVSAPGYAGLQRATWDLTRDRPRPRERGGPVTAADLRRVQAGAYVVTLSVAGRRFQQRVTVRDWPPDRLGRVR